MSRQGFWNRQKGRWPFKKAWVSPPLRLRVRRRLGSSTRQERKDGGYAAPRVVFRAGENAWTAETRALWVEMREEGMIVEGDEAGAVTWRLDTRARPACWSHSFDEVRAVGQEAAEPARNHALPEDVLEFEQLGEDDLALCAARPEGSMAVPSGMSAGP